MKNIAKTLITALAVSAAPFAAPQARAGSVHDGVSDYACVKNDGGGALSKMRVVYAFNAVKNGKLTGAAKYSPWSSVIRKGQTACVGLGFIPTGDKFYIQTRSVALGDPTATCDRYSGGIVRRLPLPKDHRLKKGFYKTPKKHISYAAKTSIIKAKCTGGPYHWDNCSGCKYKAWPDKDWTYKERKHYKDAFAEAKADAWHNLRRRCNNIEDGHPPCALFPDHVEFHTPNWNKWAKDYWYHGKPYRYY